MRITLLAFVAMLAGCFRTPASSAVPVEDDKTIAFPQFFDQSAKPVAADGELYELDGVTLRALMIAIQDFLPPGAKDPACPNRPEAQSYRVIRQGDIIFVYVYENEAYCGGSYLALDSGAKYAISSDGRILRRVLDGQPDDSLQGSGTADAGSRRVPSKPGVTPAYDSIWDRPARAAPHETQDGGAGSWDGGGAVVPLDPSLAPDSGVTGGGR